MLHHFPFPRFFHITILFFFVAERGYILLICAYGASNAFSTNRFIYINMFVSTYILQIFYFYTLTTTKNLMLIFILCCKKVTFTFYQYKMRSIYDFFWLYKHSTEIIFTCTWNLFSFVLLSNIRKNILFPSISIRVAQ